MEKIDFKPLWRIHNATYRHYAKLARWKRLKRYINKAKKILGFH